jgi:hypothetical protein
LPPRKKWPDFCQGPEFGGLALDVAVAGLPVDGGAAVLRQDGVRRVEPRRFDVDDEGRAGIERRQVAGQHQADLIGEDFLALVVDHAATIAVAVEAQG